MVFWHIFQRPHSSPQEDMGKNIHQSIGWDLESYGQSRSPLVASWRSHGMDRIHGMGFYPRMDRFLAVTVEGD